MDRPIIFSAPMVRALLDGRKTMTRRLAWRDDPDFLEVGEKPKPSPWQRVQPGDRLWVRENFIKTPAGPVYAADGSDHYGAGGKIKITPCIHMPRALSRLTLTVTAVKIHDLYYICHDDILREGVFQAAPNSWTAGDNIYAGSAYAAFSGLWNRLHGKDAWDKMPEVVAITFTVEHRNIDA